MDLEAKRHLEDKLSFIEDMISATKDAEVSERNWANKLIAMKREVVDELHQIDVKALRTWSR